MRRMLVGKRAAGLVLLAVIGVVGSYSWTARAAELEDSQQIAGAMITKAKVFAKIQAERSKVRQEMEKDKTANLGLVRMSDLLRGASPAAKEEFLDSLVLLDGKVASVALERLTRDLGKARMQKVLQTIFSSPASPASPATFINASGDFRPATFCDQNYCYGAVCTGSSTHHYCKSSETDSACGNGC